MIDAKRLAELFNGVHLGDENSLGCCNFCDASPEIREFVEAALKVVRSVQNDRVIKPYLSDEILEALAPFQVPEKEKKFFKTTPNSCLQEDIVTDEPLFSPGDK